MSTFSGYPVIKKDFYHDNKELVNLCNCERLNLSEPPSQSNFRVFCLLIVSISSKTDEYLIIQGTNSEPCYIGGSICAERSALLRLRFFRNEENVQIEKVIVTTDSLSPVSPGALCREYLISFGATTIPVLIGNCDGSNIIETTIGNLYPYPSLYRSIDRKNIMSYAESFHNTKAKHIELIGNDDLLKLYDVACQCNKYDKYDKLHPIALSSSILLKNGDIERAWQLKGLEYGCTLDSVSQLVYELERRRISVLESGNSNIHEPVYLLTVDQFGVLHSPFAQARALLVEFGYENVQIIIHDINGELVFTTPKELLPTHGNNIALRYEDFN